jgi:hypothetical protein
LYILEDIDMDRGAVVSQGKRKTAASCLLRLSKVNDPRINTRSALFVTFE